jgi:hypothetical protein
VPLSNNLSHAYIIRGGNADSAFTRELIAKMLGEPHRSKVMRGIHPDVAVVTFENNKNTGKLRTEITVDQVRDAIFAASVAPNEAAFSVIVVENAHAMNAPAQNALLKTLEEPPPHVKLILITDEPGALLATVRSRCVLLNSGAEDADAPERISALAAAYFAALGRGGSALAEFSFELDKTDKADLALLLPELTRLSVEKYRAGALPRELTLRLAELAKTAERFLSQNVAAVHVAALLCNI